MLSLAKASCRFLIRRLNFVVIQGGSLLFIFIVFVGSIVLMPLLKRSKVLITWCRAGPVNRADSFV